MRIGFLLGLMVCCFWISNGYGEEAFSIQAQAALDQDNNILNYLNHAAREVTQHSLDGIDTLAAWQAVRDQRYRQFLEMCSLTDVPLEGPRPPLNVKETGVIQQDGFHIIKLYYESLPGLYVPANLYVPDNLQEPAPAVLYVCGHSRTQKTSYQAHPRKFAQLGFVCLIIETIQYGEVLGEHHGCYARGWFNWYSRGYTPGGVELWNAIRGLDLLCERKDVNPDKLGVTGISGGGSQSWYIAAADPRIKVCAPVCGTGTVEAHVHQRTVDGHCDCMMPINTYRIDYHDIGALIAPRPLLAASANRDGLYSIESVRDSFSKVKKIYDLYGAGDHCLLVETPGGHSYHEISRTKIFSFFLKHLLGKDVPPEQVGDIDESESAMLSDEQLRAYVNGVPADDRTKTIQDSFQKMAAPPVIESENDLRNHRSKVIDFLREKTFGAFPPNPPDLSIRLEFRSLEGRYGTSRYSFVSEEGYRLKLDCQWGEALAEKRPVLLVLRNPNENRWDSEGFSSGLPGTWNRAFLEVRGVGETSWGPELQWHIRRAAAWTGRTVASMRVYDVLRALQTLRQLPGVDSAQIALAARDEMAAIALYAALLDGHIHTVLLQNPPATQDAPSSPDGRGEALEMLNCLRITDLPHVAGMLWPTRVVFLGKPHSNYDWAVEVMKAIGHEDGVRMVESFAEWKP